MIEIVAGFGIIFSLTTLFATFIALYGKTLISVFAKIKEPDEIKLLSRTLEEKREELCRRKQIEKMSFEIECIDGLLYPEEKEAHREPLNDVYEADSISYSNKPEIAPEPPMPKRGGTYEHSGPTKEEEEFYFGDDDRKNKEDE